MIDIRILATGSAGNAYILQNGAGALLIEAGISFRKIVRAIDYDLSRLDRVLISHEHADHSMAARQLVRIGAPVSMSAGTAAALDLDANLIDIVKSERQYDFGHWNILPFTTEHDAAEPLGFLISDNQGEKICYITDSAYVRYRFEGVTRWIVEANPDTCRFPDVSVETEYGWDKKVKMLAPVFTGALGSTEIARKNWDHFAVGAALSGVTLVCGENVCGIDPQLELDANGKIIDSPEMRLQSASTHIPPIGSQRPSATRRRISSNRAGWSWWMNSYNWGCDWLK